MLTHRRFRRLAYESLEARLLLSFTNLHDFSDATDGGFPRGGVAVSGSTVFGTAWDGGANNHGTIWSFDTGTSTFTNLHDFSPATDGSEPVGRVAVSGSTVFGTARDRGANNNGTIWSFDTGTSTFTNLHDFSSATDGGFPRGGVAVSGSTVFGTARDGGANNNGTIWSFDTGTSTFTNLHDFSSATDGSNPFGGVAVSGSTVFGTALFGGAAGNSQGTIWSFDTGSSTFTNLHDFSSATDGRNPQGGVAVSGSTVFGTAANGGANSVGTIWSFDIGSSTFTNLHDFSSATSGSALGLSTRNRTSIITSLP